MKMTLRSCLGLILLIIALFIISGCGGGSKEPGGSITTDVNADNAVNISSVVFTSSLPSETALLSGSQKIGTGECANCHKSVSPAVVNAWLSGPHGNNESWNATTSSKEDHWPANTGFPYYGYTGFGSDPACSTACHDPLGEGRDSNSITIANYYAATGNNTIGTANRPIIGCEACHGGGQNHFGVSAVPVARPNALRCGRCHNSQFSVQTDHNKYHPEGNGIFEDWSSSAHARSINSPNHVAGSTTDIRARCSRCHTDEGARSKISIVNGTESYNDLITKLDGSADIINASVDQCRTCHDSHNPKNFLGSKATYTSGSLAATTWSDQFRTCTLCHQLFKEDNTLNTEAYHNPTVNTKGNLNEIITDTHYDDPTTPDIEGYIINPAGTHSGMAGNTNSGVCPDCHNPHNADNTINRQWARSAHGGHIMADDGTTGIVTEAGGAKAWVHYDFKGADRAACQRCHTATGFRNFANNPSAYNPVNNVFIAQGAQKEMLYCWACHTDNKGGLRNPGAITALYTDNSQPFIFPDIKGSNVCIACHAGRENGDSVKKKAGSWDSLSFVNSHYLSAGGTVFTVTGYEYASVGYANPVSYRHDQIGSNGPCVGCHMSSTEKHLFLPVSKTSDGVIISITSSICANCHVGVYSLTTAILEDDKEHFKAALEALKAQLAANGYNFTPASPYFVNKNWLSPGDADLTGNTTGKNNMGAAFNYNLLVHDTGAFAHNSYYAKRLIYDSIDWLDNNSLDGSVTTAINNLGSLTALQKSAALTYLNNGVRP